MTESTTSETDAQTAETADLGRRTFVIGTGAAVATVAGAGAIGTAAAAEFNHTSEYSPAPALAGSVTIEEHDADEMSSALEYIADDGSTASLGADGFEIASREADDEPHTPVRYRPDRLDTEEYLEFPRGEYREVDDDDDEPISWTDAGEWSGDASSATAASGADAIEVAGSATFDAFEIDSGVRRKYLQAVVFVDDVDATEDEPVELVFDVTDSSAAESVSVTVDMVDETSYVVQEQIGDLDGAGGLGAIDEITVDTGTATVTIAALNLDRESAWSFGETEVLEENDDGDEIVETETVREPVGDVELRAADGGALSTVDDRLVETITDIEIDVEQPISGLGSDAVSVEFEDADRHNPDTRMRLLTNFETPTAYDLSWSDDLELADTVAHPGERHRAVEFATGRDDQVELDDVDDVDWSDRTVDYQDSDVDDELTLTTSIDPGEITALHYEILVTDDEQSDLEDTSVIGGPTGQEGGGGILGTVMGIALSILGALGLRSYVNR